VWLPLAADNRDATYLSTLPFNTLSQPGQLLLVAGVNYVEAGVQRACSLACIGHMQLLVMELAVMP